MDYIFTFFIIIVILSFLIFVGRELVTWYWKINEIVKLLHSINKKLDNSKEHQDRF